MTIAHWDHEAQIARIKANHPEEFDVEAEKLNAQLSLISRADPRLSFVSPSVLNGAPPSASYSIPLADVGTEQIVFILKDRIALGMLSLLDGDPGVGKSTVAIDLAARLSTCRPLPGESKPALATPASVILISGEDGPGNVIKPRVAAAHGDLKLVRFLRDVPSNPGPHAPRELLSFPKHLSILRNEVLACGAKLVVIDPVTSFVTEGTNLLKDQDARRVVGGLAQIAAETNCAIVIIRHFTKTKGRNVLHQGGGAVALVAQARFAMCVTPVPDDPKARALASYKANLAEIPPARIFKLSPSNSNGFCVVRWGGESNLTIEELLAVPTTAEERTLGEHVREYLKHATESGAIRWSDAVKELQEGGFFCDKKTIQRAVKRLQYESGFVPDRPPVRFIARPGQPPPGLDTLKDTQDVQTGLTRGDADSVRGVDTDALVSRPEDGTERSS